MFCKNCGTQLEDYARFCKNCGTSVALPAQETSVQVPDTQAAVAKAAQSTYEQNLSFSDVSDSGIDEYGNTAPAAFDSLPRRSKGSSSGLAVFLVVATVIVHLVAVAIFAFLPVYKVSVDVSAKEQGYTSLVQYNLKNQGVEVPKTEELTAFDITDKTVSGLEFLDVKTDDVFGYVAIGLIAVGALGGIIMLAPVFSKRSLHPALGLTAVVTQIIMLSGAAVLLIVSGNNIKSAMDTYLINFAKGLVLDNSISIESTTTVGIGVMGFVFIGVAALSIVVNAIAVIAGRKSSQKAI